MLREKENVLRFLIKKKAYRQLRLKTVNYVNGRYIYYIY